MRSRPTGKTFLGRGFALLLTLIWILASVPAGAMNPKISVSVGQSVTQEVPGAIKTVSIANTDVADVVVAGPRQILVNGKAVGFTTLVVWDEANRSTIYNVVVRGPFSDQQIELRVKVMEVNRTYMRELGLDFLISDDNGSRALLGASFAGEVLGTPRFERPIGENTIGESVALGFSYASGGTELLALVKALQSDGALRILAEPNVVASSGSEASFLSGGEVPIPVTQTGTTGIATVTIEYKEFGVSIEFLPTIVDSGVINLQVAPEVSNLDFQNGVVLAGFQIPALQTRRASTTVELMDEEVLVIGGLLLEAEDVEVRKVPFLGHIPLLGLLFTNERVVKSQQELLLVVSPKIIRALPPGTVVDLPSSGEDG
jgi:pilus assembly protein CpaC